MKKVTGIGGVFFKAEDPKKLTDWYSENLGIQKSEHGAIVFEWANAENPNEKGQTVFSLFKKDTGYFGKKKTDFMMNFRVENLEELLKDLRSRGIEVEEKTEEYEYGKFGWIIDPEGNRIELWEPA